MRWMVALVCAAGVYAADPGVSRELARQRANAGSNVRYEIALDIKEKVAGYPAHLSLSFDLAEKPDPIVLDFRDDSSRSFGSTEKTPRLHRGTAIF
jgi:hypothetical protein